MSNLQRRQHMEERHVFVWTWENERRTPKCLLFFFFTRNSINNILQTMFVSDNWSAPIAYVLVGSRNRFERDFTIELH